MKPRAYYQPYQSGLLLAQAFSPSKTPLLRMEHLRQLDFPISREISYERTVDEFLLQLAVNDALRALRSRKDMVILLNEEGALIREDWHWSLLFTPTAARSGPWVTPPTSIRSCAAWLSAGRAVRSAGWRCPTGA